MENKSVDLAMAWLSCAEKWLNARIIRKYAEVFSNRGYRHDGLCQLIEEDFPDLYTEMKAQIDKLPDCPWETDYKWMLNLDGARQRFEFCIEQAIEELIKIRDMK